MRSPSLVLSILAFTLCAAQDSAPANAGPSIKWRGSVWASALWQDRDTTDGSLVFRPVDPGDKQFSLDGLSLGVDVALGAGWTLRLTTMTGQMGKIINVGSGESGTLAVPEAQLVWTGKNDTVRLGRMTTFIGMEFLDGPANITASRGLLFAFADPVNQIGLNWHHAFSPEWSADLWAFNGEDRIQDNNQGKTFGLGLTYNHGGAADKYVSVHAYRGPEQNGLGEAKNTGAEGRMRERLCMMGSWSWGASTLVWEVSSGKETFTPEAVAGLSKNESASWMGLGAIFKHSFNERWALFARAERFQDDMGVRLSMDPSIGPLYGNKRCADLKASNFSLGLERKMGPAYLRFELRQDSLNRELKDLENKTYKSAASATLQVGASF